MSEEERVENLVKDVVRYAVLYKDGQPFPKRWVRETILDLLNEARIDELKNVNPGAKWSKDGEVMIVFERIEQLNTKRR